MTKFWKIKNSPDIKLSLEKLNLNSNHIDILLEEGSDFIYYLNEQGYVFIGYNDNRKDDLFGNFGWCEDENFYLSYGYKYCGEINFRKEKILKLNGEFN